MAPPFALLDDCEATASAPTSRLCTGFVREHRCVDPDALESVCDAAEADLANGLHAMLVADYEWGARLMRIGREAPGTPTGALRWLMFERCSRLSRQQVDAWLASQDQEGDPSPAGFAGFRGSVDRGGFDAAVARIQALIRDGHTYQINYTFRLEARAFGSTAALYRRLRRRQPVRHGAWIALPDGTHILSCSPELFVRHEKGHVVARPMKGTAPRGTTPDEDLQAASWLEHDAKNRAENLMIVDLMRNDLGRVAEVASVRVPSLFAVEPHGTVLQMTSTIEARLPAATRFSDLLRALFPCGSITGAPKRRSMELIAGLEDAPRGVYTGAIGWVDAPSQAGRRCGDFCLSVAIRTLEIDVQRRVRLGVGAGIVADSAAADEWDECWLKARFATALDPGLTLFETMRASRDEGAPLLQAHLDRLQASARALGFAFDREAVRERMAAVAKALPAGSWHRVRVDLRHDGRLTITHSPLAPQSTPVVLRLARAPRPREEGVLAAHKTSLRACYDASVREAEREGAFDTLFADEAGRLTEGARSNVFVKLDGRWYTPALQDHGGPLPGLMRAAMLADPQWDARERTLTLDDLRRAEGLTVCNALRGPLPARLMDGTFASADQDCAAVVDAHRSRDHEVSERRKAAVAVVVGQ